MRPALPFAAAVAFAVALLLCQTTGPLWAQEDGGTAVPPKTAKERQAGKAYDPQRVNDCKVPPELRGDKARSADCGEKAKAVAQEGEAKAAGEKSSD